MTLMDLLISSWTWLKKKKFSEPEDISVESSKSKKESKQREKKKRMDYPISKDCGTNTKSCNVHIMEIPDGEEIEKGTEYLKQ